MHLLYLVITNGGHEEIRSIAEAANGRVCTEEPESLTVEIPADEVDGFVAATINTTGLRRILLVGDNSFTEVL